MSEKIAPNCDEFARRAAHQARVEQLAGRLQVPRDRAGRADARLRVGAVNPDHRAAADAVHLPARHQLVDANVLDGAILFIRDQHRRHRPPQRRPRHRELQHELGDQRDVAQAVGRAAAVQVVALHRELERVALPRLRVRRHHVHVAADERDAALARAGVRDDHVAAALLEGDALDRQRAVRPRVRRERREHVLAAVVLAWVQVLRRVVLQRLRLAHELREQRDVPALVERERAELGLGLLGGHRASIWRRRRRQ